MKPKMNTEIIATRLIIIKPGSQEERTVSIAAEPTYREIAEMLDPIFYEQRKGPTNWEHVLVFYEGQYRDAFVDEYGSGCCGKPRLPVNIAATKIYHANVIVHEGVENVDGIMPDGAPIFGWMVLFPTRRIWT